MQFLITAYDGTDSEAQPDEAQQDLLTSTRHRRCWQAAMYS